MKIKCASQDICERYKNGTCRILKKMRISISMCSERELTKEGKKLVKSGDRV